MPTPKKTKIFFTPAAITMALVVIFFFGNSLQFIHAQGATPSGAPDGAASEYAEGVAERYEDAKDAFEDAKSDWESKSKVFGETKIEYFDAQVDLQKASGKGGDLSEFYNKERETHKAFTEARNEMNTAYATMKTAKEALDAAAGTVKNPDDEEAIENEICQKNMEELVKVELASFRTWLKQHFQNESSTTSLLSEAFDRYNQMRDSLYREFARYYPQQGAYQLGEALEPGACLAQMDEALAEARRALESEARQTSTVKKATIMINKYQEINTQLRNLNMNFVYMKKYLDTFADKLPCYIRKSCNKG